MKTPFRTNLHHPSTVLLVALLALVGYQSFGNRPAPTLAPTVIATVNIQQMFDELKMKPVLDEELKKMAGELNDQAIAREKELKQLNADLTDHQPGSPAYQQTESKAILATEQYRGFMEFCKAKIDIEKGRTLRRIYLEIKKAAQQMADSNGYDMVLVDDSLVELPTGGEDDTRRQISGRRMLYSTKRIDITAALLADMNAAFAGPAGAAAGANPAKNP